MIKYRTEITKLVKDQADGTVTRAYWRLTGKDTASGKSQEGVGSTLVRLDAGGKFIPFEQLTDRAVKRWIKDSPEIAARKADIERSLATSEVAPPEIVAPPWAAPAASSTQE